MKFSVTLKGQPLDPSLYNWDEKTKTFSSNESHLVLDFSEIHSVTFNMGGYDCTFTTGYNCKFYTGSDCTFNTGSNCTFKTDSNCTFNTDSHCTFDSESNCEFYTESGCTFKTGSFCKFKTGSNCTFDAGYGCTFNTGSDCTFDTGYGCTFTTGAKCVVVRRDLFEVIQLEGGNTIKLNDSGEKGFTYLTNHVIIIDGEERVISQGSYDKVKEALGGN